MRKSVHTPEYALLKEELRAARVAASLSQRELAAALRVPPSVVAKIESGERRTDVVEFCWFMIACEADSVAAFHRIAARAADSRNGPKKRSRGR